LDLSKTNIDHQCMMGHMVEISFL